MSGDNRLCMHEFLAHRCRYPGCGGVIILDGNMKNQRNICAATEAGYVQYQHLPGSIKTGCQLSPPSTSKYCYLHAPRVCVGMSMNTPDLGCEQSDSQPGHKSACEGVLRYITGKKITRNQVYYQVLFLACSKYLKCTQWTVSTHLYCVDI